MASTTNYKLTKPSYTSSADISELNNNFDKIDKGLTLDVGTSTGTGNNYILDFGSIILTSANRGISFKFFADKNANGNVTINTNYNLIKANKNPVKNLKSGAPYIITYDGGTNFFLASGSGEEDSTTVTSDNVLKDVTYVGQDGEVYKGAMPNNGALNASIGVNGNFNIPKGFTEGGKVTQSIPNNGAINASLNCGDSKGIPAGYTSGGTISANSLASQTPSNADASKIVAGCHAWVNGADVWGTASIQSLGGMQIVSGTTLVKVPYPTSRFYLDLDGIINFTPKIIYGLVNGSGRFVRTDSWVLCYDLFKSAYNTSNMSGVPSKGAVLGEGDAHNQWSSGDRTVTWYAIG